jgi:hypothetical protein
MRGPWGPQTNISQFLCVALVVIYLFRAICALNHLDFSGYNMTYPDVAHFEAHFANFRDFWPIEGK